MANTHAVLHIHTHAQHTQLHTYTHARTRLQAYIEKGPARVYNLRPDSLGIMLSLANVAAGAKVSCVSGAGTKVSCVSRAGTKVSCVS